MYYDSHFVQLSSNRLVVFVHSPRYNKLLKYSSTNIYFLELDLQKCEYTITHCCDTEAQTSGNRMLIDQLDEKRFALIGFTRGMMYYR